MAPDQVQLTTTTHSPWWLSIFPRDIKTLQGSTIFVKQLTALAFSCITYMRSIFPEYAYQPREIDDEKVKVLSGSYDCKDAYLMTRWIKSAFDALDKRYMRELILEILSVDDKLLEYYAIVYKYNENGPSCTLSANGGNLDFDIVKMENATKQLIKTLLTSTEALEDLPKKYQLQLRVNYYDEVTPTHYKPKYFSYSTYNDFKKLDVLKHKEIGGVETPYHSLNIYCGSSLLSLENSKQAFFKDLSDENSQPMVEETYMSDSSQRGTEAPSMQIQKETSIIIDDSNSKTLEDKPLIQEEVPALKPTQIIEQKQPQVNCICSQGFTEDKEFPQNSSETFMCVHCKSLHHKICYKILASSGEIENGCCYSCAGLVSYAKCTDTDLTKCKPRKAVNVAAYRQLLVYLQDLKLVSLKTLKDFGFTRVLAENMFSKLKKEKLIKPSNNSKVLFTINKPKLKHYVKQYFDV